MNNPKNDINKEKTCRLIRIRRRLNLSDDMFFAKYIDLAMEIGVNEIISVTPPELIKELDSWLPRDVEDLLMIPGMPCEMEVAVKDTMKTLREKVDMAIS